MNSFLKLVFSMSFAFIAFPSNATARPAMKMSEEDAKKTEASKKFEKQRADFKANAEQMKAKAEELRQSALGGAKKSEEKKAVQSENDNKLKNGKK